MAQKSLARESELYVSRSSSLSSDSEDGFQVVYREHHRPLEKVPLPQLHPRMPEDEFNRAELKETRDEPEETLDEGEQTLEEREGCR